jgi:hypothetical protein
LKLPLVTTKAADEIAGVSSDFEKFQNFQPWRQDRERKAKEKKIVGWLRSLQTQSLSHEETSEPMKANWSQSALKEQEYSITLRDPCFKCCNSSLRWISWILDWWLKVDSSAIHTAWEVWYTKKILQGLENKSQVFSLRLHCSFLIYCFEFVCLVIGG